MRLTPLCLLATAALFSCSKALPDLADTAAGTSTDGTDGPVDADGDGFSTDDCDDSDAEVNPAAQEVCDGADNDCDGETDEGLTQGWWRDEDEDGHGAGEPVEACAAPAGWVASADDCDDGDPAVSPSAEEVCNGVDDDCDEEVDEGLEQTWYTDADADGYGDPAGPTTSDCDPGPGWSLDATDCDDTTADRWPGATSDFCDGLDNDCDGTVDEDVKAGWILISVDSSAGQVVQIDPGTGATSVLSTLSGASYAGSLNSMDVRANDGLSIVHDSAGQILGLDACTGVLSTIGPTNVGDMGGISFAGSGVLYGISQASDELMQIDPFTGGATPLGDLGFDLSASGIAYDCATDTLYGADTSGMVFQVDTSTGLLHRFVMTSVPFSGVGLEYDPYSQKLLAGTGLGNALYVVDPASGSSTRVGTLGTANANDLALHPPCP